MLKSKLNCQVIYDQVWYVMKTRQDNDMIDRTDVVYANKNLSCYDRLDWV